MLEQTFDQNNSRGNNITFNISHLKACDLLWWKGSQVVTYPVFQVPKTDVCMIWLWLAQGWLWANYELAISWLWAGYWLAMTQNQYTSRHNHILCSKVAHGCNQYFGLCSRDILTISWQLAGYRLAIGWLSAGYQQAIGWLWPKINTLQDVVIYYVPKWHMAAFNTLDCSVFTRFVGFWLAIGWLCTKLIHFNN